MSRAYTCFFKVDTLRYYFGKDPINPSFFPPKIKKLRHFVGKRSSYLKKHKPNDLRLKTFCSSISFSNKRLPNYFN